MKVLVCGSRHFNNPNLMKEVLDKYQIDEIIEGEARGADTLALLYGLKTNIPVRRYPADWNKHGKAAGPIRNSQMLKEGKPDLVVAFLYNDSRGTKNMVEQAKKAEVPVEEIWCDESME